MPLNERFWFRLLMAPIIAFLWLIIATVWALMLGKRDAATFRTLAFGFVLVTAFMYVIEVTSPNGGSPIWMGVATIFIVLSMWWFRNRIKHRKD